MQQHLSDRLYLLLHRHIRSNLGRSSMGRNRRDLPAPYPRKRCCPFNRV